MCSTAEWALFRKCLQGHVTDCCGPGNLLSIARMLLVLSEEHKEHLSFLTKVDVDGKCSLRQVILGLPSMSLMVLCVQW